MIYVKDNFLDSKTFQLINQYMNNIYDNDFSIKEILSDNTNKENLKTATIMTKFGLDSSDLDIRNKLGGLQYSIYRQLKDEIESTVYSQIILYDWYLQYLHPSHWYWPKTDKCLGSNAAQDCYTSFLWLHSNFTPYSGGYWQSDKEMINPLPNRLLVYSRDQKHSTVTCKNETAIRFRITCGWLKQ